MLPYNKIEGTINKNEQRKLNERLIESFPKDKIKKVSVHDVQMRFYSQWEQRQQSYNKYKKDGGE